MQRTCRGMFVVVLLFAAAPAPARELEGVTVPEAITLPGDTTPLVLNGAGVRTHLFLKIYVGALYLPNRQSELRAILDEAGPKSVRATFLYGLTVERVRYAWYRGFTRNLSEHELKALRPRLTQFIDLLGPTERGDVVHFDYRPAQGTEIRFNGERRGVIPGADFHRALLKIWLGERAEDAALKRALLGLE